MAVKECEINGIVIAQDTSSIDWDTAFTSSTNHNQCTVGQGYYQTAEKDGWQRPYCITVMEFSIPNINGTMNYLELKLHTQYVSATDVNEGFTGDYENELFGEEIILDQFRVAYLLFEINESEQIYPNYDYIGFPSFHNCGYFVDEEIEDPALFGYDEFVLKPNKDTTVQIGHKKLQPNRKYVLSLYAFCQGQVSQYDVSASSIITSFNVNYTPNGLVYIDNGSNLVPYQCYIDNGSSWDQYMPYVDNGSSWDLYS